MFESNDTFVEDAVKSKPTGSQGAIRIASLVITIILAIATLMGVFLPFSAVLCIIFIVTTFIIMGNKNIEFEYDYTNGSLEIAKIINNEKRKKIVSVESAEIRQIAAIGTNESLKYDNVKMKIYDCSAHDEDVKDYILVAHNEEKNYDFKVLFSPSEKLINAMKKYNKRDIYE